MAGPTSELIRLLQDLQEAVAGAPRLLDLGVASVENAPETLYTPAEGERVLGFYWSDVTLTDAGQLIVKVGEAAHSSGIPFIYVDSSSVYTEVDGGMSVRQLVDGAVVTVAELATEGSVHVYALVVTVS